MATIAWIGLGNMGHPMTANLVRAGHTVRGFDLSAPALEAAAADGVVAVGSSTEALEGAEIAFTMLPRGEHALAAYQGPEGIFANAAPGTLLIDCSTIDVASARTLHDEAAAAGFEFLDAPVSGGIAGAQKGTLAFMIGGESAVVEKARPFIEPMAGNIIATGEATTGQAAKICNNLMLFINMVSSSEAAVLADRLGLDHEVFYSIATVSSGDSWPLRTWYPYPGVVESSPANHDFAPTFTADLANKDIRLALAAAEETDTPLVLGSIVQEMLQKVSDAGAGDRDCSIVKKLVDGSFES
ncbi:3-hydroxyisobutyrate dehydrogenase [Brevibacterium ihuae]|uniref:3-hydroxyisobutyrate dehydrogenase n=1 Tax=Brevibacterium ihuae TaxID=1631743 RepID=UPI000C76853F|nr:3-hydroxyisobutyrate dehydrogenase [Brevibacterium ihuae]